MGRGGQKRDVIASDRSRAGSDVLTWAEISRHVTNNDRWIVIGGEVYDVTEWSKKHPGGPRLIGHYAGQDATDAFGAFHNNGDHVRKFLKPLHVGSVEGYTDNDLDKDFRELKSTAVKMGWFQPSYTFYTLVVGHVVLFQVLTYMVLHWFDVTWWSVLLSLACFTIAQSQAGWTQHDFGHLSVFKHSWLDHGVHHFLIGIIMGASSSWWNHMHYQHHAKPNVINKDPDVRLEQLFVVGDEMPKTVAKKKKKSMPFNLQHKYFFALGPPLLYPVYFQIMLFRHMITRRLWNELTYSMVFYISYIYLFVPKLGFFGAVAMYFAMRCLESHWFTWVSQSNHIPMTVRSDQSLPWLVMQLNATCDIEKSPFNDWFTGHLNFQIEHHLFPTMPRHNLYKVAPLVQSLCKKHGIPYTVKPLLQSFVDIVRSLKVSGEMWKEAYEEIHS
ncbi:acyl-CoA 6-desaturase-like isoform X2 [Dreissena polymorpha]|uniref:Cytochrome b5 heme-binding domain-containing protein n=2 Tax=Dreissena polymorpha TaxID=45954 RepID=A0A9D4RCC6_DREPO|nr:acyl-CoA 6-desaturase-like isoform X2 [Dreissena polymorpha]XP_052262111.1 acyl-CoA 6-desaturase-like isoform X2 [Dreissena polymorpha]KAH3861557.1 hypothetical protein DPMN_024489 [Dreissena polymorpha]